MKIFFGQIYVRPGVKFPFSFHFQKWLSEALSKRVEVSDKFTQKFGNGYGLGIRISAKMEVDRPEIKGPTVFKRDKDVEFTIFLPYQPKNFHDLKVAWPVVEQLIEASVRVLSQLGLDPKKLIADTHKLRTEFLSTPSFLEPPDRSKGK